MGTDISDIPSKECPPWLECPEEAHLWVRIKEAAYLLNITYGTARRWHLNGYMKELGMPTFRFGGMVFVRVKPQYLKRKTNP